MRPSRFLLCLLLFAGCVLPLGMAELTLRWTTHSLPSLAALDGVDPREIGEFNRWTDPKQQPPDCRAAPGAHRLYYRPRTYSFAPTSSDPVAQPSKLWVVGDSVVAGWGVPTGTAWPHTLARQLSADLDQPVELTLVGGAGLGHCELLLDTHRLADGSSPDTLVFQLFGDDLEYRTMVQVRGRVAARPDGVPGAVGLLARHSWLANRLWFDWVTRLGGAAPARELDVGARARFVHALQTLAHRLELAGTRTSFVLVPPAGIGRCSQGDAWSDCDWLIHDLDWMAQALDESALPWLDLRNFWQEHDPQTLPDEEAGWHQRKHLPVHPGVRGHAALAGAVLSALEPHLALTTRASTP